jgi:molybdopterin converting factor subunit 1
MRYFAQFRELTHKADETFDLPAAANVAALVQILQDKYEGIDRYITMSRIAVNQEFRDMQDTLADGDEVAFVPPVSGG